MSNFVREFWGKMKNQLFVSDKKDQKYEDIYSAVMSSGSLPPASDEDAVADAVWALWQHGLGVFGDWHKRVNEHRQWYRGEKRPEKRFGWSANVNYNIIKTDIDTLKPIIRDALIKPGLFGKDEEKAKILDMRVSSIWRRSNFQSEKAASIIQNLCIDGSVFFKTIYDGDENDARAIHIDCKRLVWDENREFDEAMWIIDARVATISEARKMFGKIAESIQPNTKILETKEGEPSGPPLGGTSAAPTNYNYDTPVGDETTGTRIVIADHSYDYSTKFKKANMLLLLELWVWDETQDDKGNYLYPDGRLVTIGVGCKGKAGQIDVNYGTDREIATLQDRQVPPVYKYLAEKKRRHPFVKVDCYDINDIWGESEVGNRIDMQKLINHALNATIDSWNATNWGTIVVAKKYGMSRESITNDPTQVIEIEANIDDVRKAYYRDNPPSVAAATIPFLQTFLELNKDLGGRSDILMGRNPPGVTAGVSLDLLKTAGSGRFVYIAENLNAGFIKVYYNLGCIIQGMIEAGIETTDHELYDEDLDDENKIKRNYIAEYNPEDLSEQDFRVEATRQLTLSEASRLLSLASQLDQAMMGLGELALSYADDKALMGDYRRIQQQAQKDKLALLEKEGEIQNRNNREQFNRDLAKEIALNKQNGGSYGTRRSEKVNQG